MSELKNAVAGKEVIYIDVDEEITGIIDKVRGSKSKIVALVLPKRAAVLQSVVNMKLLKRSAANFKKHVVLITSEPALMPIAGAAGVLVAKSLQSRPSVPVVAHEDGANAVDEEEVIHEQDTEPDFDTAKNGQKPVGELSKQATPPASEETIELDDPDAEKPGDFSTAAAATPKQAKTKPNKKLKVPNFNKFRMLLFAGGVLLIALAVLGYFAVKVWPKSEITILTDATDVNSRLNIGVNSNTQAIDEANLVVPAKLQQSKKSQTHQVAATGQKNNGQRATGEIKISNCTDETVSVESGIGVSVSGVTFITTEAAGLEEGNFTSGNVCKTSGDHTAVVSVRAINPGTQYNNVADGATLTFAVSMPSGVKATWAGYQTQGTDEIVKIVNQADIDNARQKMSTEQSDSVKTELQTALKQTGYVPIAATYHAGEPQVVTSAKAGDQADTVTVTQTIAYTMLGARKSDLAKLVEANVSKQIDKETQKILNNGVDKASFTVLNGSDPANMQVTMSTISRAGPDVSIEEVKAFAAGKKGGAIQDHIKQTKGVTDVTVKYSPFWVTSVPKDQSKITVNIEKAN